jgi:hypothetical protein
LRHGSARRNCQLTEVLQSLKMGRQSNFSSQTATIWNHDDFLTLSGQR